MSRVIPYFNSSASLPINLELVYLDNPDTPPDTSGITQVAFVHRSFVDPNKKTWYEVSLLTDSDGSRIGSNNKIFVGGDKIMSNKNIRKINNRKIYYMEDEIVATNFASANKNINDIMYISYASNESNPNIANKNLMSKTPLESTSRSAIGSGIYGKNFPNITYARALTLKNTLIHELDMTNAYDVQDKEHGESITIASLLTNRYLDKIISNSIYTKNTDNIGDIIKNDNIENLVILWNIVFYRTGEYISYEILEKILSNYLIRYFSQSTIKDKRNDEPLIALPINYIMMGMGYDGLLADDQFNNGWGRGCVSFNYDNSDSFTLGKAFY
jgi:hypothetical protein